MMKNFVLVFLVYLSVASCNESLNDIDKNVVSATFLEQSESNLILKQKFSSALVKVLGQNEEVRSLIKEEALKQINEKHYAQAFAADERELIKIGVNFSNETRNIEKWIVE